MSLPGLANTSGRWAADERAVVDKLTGKEYRTFPMVFFNREFVGGYEEVKFKIDTELTFDAVYF